jgi:hypothetical protein
MSYGHGNNATGSEKKSILHPDLKTIPHQPQVQLIGNGFVQEHEGLVNVCPTLGESAADLSRLNSSIRTTRRSTRNP